jgi:hypothetical protein
MTTRYLHLTTPTAALSYRFPDQDWVDNAATRNGEFLAQMGELLLLGESLRKTLRGRRRNRQLEAIATFKDADGHTVPLEILYGYDAATLRLYSVRFTRGFSAEDEDLVVEYDLDTRHVRLLQSRWS